MKLKRQVANARIKKSDCIGEKTLYNKRNNQQNKKTAYEMGKKCLQIKYLTRG